MMSAPSDTKPICDLHLADLVYRFNGYRFAHECPRLACDRQAVLSSFDNRWRLSDAATRYARIRAHDALDELWQSGRMTRREAYRWLALELGIRDDRRDCHIAHFNAEQCRRVVEVIADSMTLIRRTYRRRSLVRGGLNTA